MKSGFVAIVGRPNAGKSTLLNHVLGAELSIVTPKAQTTRERVLGILTVSRAALSPSDLPQCEGQIVFIDTPGIHKAKIGGINEYMVGEAKEALDSPSCVWYLIDPRSKLEHETPVIAMLAHLKASGTPVFPLLNKADLIGRVIPEEQAQALESSLFAALKEVLSSVRPVFRIAAQKGKGVPGLLEATWALMPEGPMYYEDPEQLSDRPTRFFVAEQIREQLYLKLGEELPYSCGVEIEKFDEKAVPLRIEAVIYVERESQKGMVVGKGGAKIKEIGQAARATIEGFLGQKIFLGLRVKVLKEWTRDVAALERMGYRTPR